MSGLKAIDRAACAQDLAPLASSFRIAPVIFVAGGSLAIVVGLLVYATDRAASHAAVIPALALVGTGSLFGASGQWLPSFVHPFAFSLFTAAAHPSRMAPAYWACAAWWVVNVVFEVAQLPGINLRIATGLQDGFGPTWLTRPLANYVLRGTFDVGDLMAATAGALVAASVLHVDHRLGVTHGH
jgi:hypothetical protein